MRDREDNTVRHIVNMEELKGIITRNEIVGHAGGDGSKQLVVVTDIDNNKISFSVTSCHIPSPALFDNLADAVANYNSI